MTGKPAFTLVELVIVLAITCILSAIAFPVMVAAYHKQTLYLAARQMEADILEQQQAAISYQNTSNTYEVLLDVERDQYTLRIGALEIIRTVRLPPNVDMENASGFGSYLNQKILQFNCNGVPTQAGHVTLRDRSSGKRYYVIITPVTGRVRISTASPS
ncbi:GspH/FimT family protein [Desulfurispora thermophila]|uniref:GspH/FimT family protein n=1 Tax=Desulfurispora thermophila TaxID=265470 RepID=UPI00037BAF3A|nr:GspH/FimT family protein [Desulfurispora thermophila]